MIENLLTIPTTSKFLINKLTNELTSYVRQPISGFMVYIYPKKQDGKWIIRYPGMSIGYLEVDDEEVITNIVLNNDTNLFNDGVECCYSKYNGKRLVVAHNGG